MNIMSICSNGDVLAIMRIIRIVIRIITIAAPIALIISLSLNYVSAIKDQDEDALNKANKNAVPKIIAAILIFFIPGFVNLLADIVDYNKNTYLSCLKIATTENVKNPYIDDAISAVNQVKLTLDSNDYATAEKAVSKVKDDSKKQQLKNELDLLRTYIDINNKIDDLEKTFDRNTYYNIKSTVDSIQDDTVRSKLQGRLADIINRKGLISLFDLNPNGSLFKTNSTLNTSLSSVLQQHGSSVDKLNSKIELNVNSVGVGSREAPVIASLTLIEELSKLGYHIGYSYYGRYDTIGVNPNWGNIGISDEGFINWALRQGFNSTNISNETVGTYNSVSMNQKTEAICNVGDVLVKDDHIQLVAYLDNTSSRYITIESNKSYGLRLSTVAYNSSIYNCRTVKGYSN